MRPLTQQRANEEPQIPSKSEIAKRPRLRLLRAVLAEHRSDRDYSTGEDAGETSANDHLPQRLAHTEQCHCNRYSNERDHKRRFSSPAIRSL